MVKHKSVKEMMAERKPLLRKPVEPINIYSAPPATQETKTEPARVVPQVQKTPAKKETKPAHDSTEPLRPYSTYLRKGQVIGVKLRAVERDVNDMEIVQEAIDEYFKRHPL